VRVKESVKGTWSYPTASGKPRGRLTRRGFLRLDLAERRRILAQQAEALLAHYQEDSEWKETEVQDLLEP
jgi:hypothetical protein